MPSTLGTDRSHDLNHWKFASVLPQKYQLTTYSSIAHHLHGAGACTIVFQLSAPLQAFGDVGYAARIDHSAMLAKHFEQSIQASNGTFVLSHPRSFVNVCFWWIPPALRPFNAATASKEDFATLGKVSFNLPKRHAHAVLDRQSGGVCPGFVSFQYLVCYLAGAHLSWQQAPYSSKTRCAIFVDVETAVSQSVLRAMLCSCSSVRSSTRPSEQSRQALSHM